jgi:hypothetical protein
MLVYDMVFCRFFYETTTSLTLLPMKIPIVIVSAARTPLGGFQGALAAVSGRGEGLAMWVELL